MKPSNSDTPVFRFANAVTALDIDGDERFESVEQAEKWLSGGDDRAVGGLIPYENDGHGCSLFGGSLRAPAEEREGVEPRFRYDVRFNASETERYLSSLDTALHALGGGERELEKVVLARVERYLVDGELDVDALYRIIREAYPAGNNFRVRNLHRPHSYHLGSSPELFLRRHANRIVLHPLAGTLPKDPRLSEEDDRRRARRLLATAKFRSEHAYLVDFLREGLAPYCSRLDVPAEPSLVSASHVWHLGTPIEGTLRSDEIALSEMLGTLHPSPAVCGVPRDEANEFILEHEGERSYYAGLVGWFDGPRDCEFYMALRGMEADVAAGHVDLRAGGGIVRGSSIPMEFGEVGAKMSTMRQVLDLDGDSLVRSGG
ncbi:hypothetical protein CDG81_12710 [Actinopolyspora erythraea]|uniref:Chorismate-utilising enzyme C-terminal domain-containing protein n=1 Tax=Actinopolyspora erythraea TaxID=414996 RepID=A0A223RT08_9ACTN|nr:chorismate-binding protein [Actinopolyspora erythraea]ASU79006.1 hypothetical protein CDG81_12710 [Actinopolyspora erythraea]